MLYDIRKGQVVETEMGRFSTRERAEKELARQQRAKANRKAKEDAMRSLGLVKVRGALGGTYWE